MSTFKVGQRVVCIKEFKKASVGIFNKSETPKINEIVTINMVEEDDLRLEEYYYSSDGYVNLFSSKNFRPLDDTFAEETEAMVQKFATGIEEYLEIIKETETIKIK